MAKILACVLAAGFAGTSTYLLHGLRTQPQLQTIDARMGNDGAYRDGLFVGRLTREMRRPTVPPIGRWATAKDRASFIQGYRRALANTPPNR